VALGGGSVMDAAKVLAAASRATSRRVRSFLVNGQGTARRWAARRSSPCPDDRRQPAARSRPGPRCGTPKRNEEVLAGPCESLYPEAALVDPLLTVGLPRGITISTGLDALSHALESIWNVNANPVSTALAGRGRRARRARGPAAAGRRSAGTRRSAHAAGARQPVRGARLLQHAHLAGPLAVLSSDAAPWGAARHRLLVQPADGDARGRRLRSPPATRRCGASSAPTWWPAPGASKRCWKRLGVSTRMPPRTGSPPGTGPRLVDRRAGGRARTQLHRTPGGAVGRNGRVVKSKKRLTMEGTSNDQDDASRFRASSPRARCSRADSFAGSGGTAHAQQVLKVGLIPVRGFAGHAGAEQGHPRGGREEFRS
jgi:hypothetical protein